MRASTIAIFIPTAFAFFGCSTAPSETVGNSSQHDLGDVASITACPFKSANPSCPAGQFLVVCTDGSVEVDSLLQILADQVCVPGGSADGGLAPDAAPDAALDAALDASIPFDAGFPDVGMTDASVLPDAGDPNACLDACEANNPAAYVLFAGYELTNCACQAGAPCAGACTAECANPTTLTSTSTCGVCLAAQEAMAANSSCIVTAAETCFGNAACSPLLTCGEACP